ncbi:XrtA/PEP-CTERM system TPR-repeat protein PrsT [Bowmanella yangjiangensis]|uniref:PEP-CTERM system TPR-repeat protein PrsT n=1 Tax=Bowmanella yangjiangensis TaxID=2811230 RepID=A0ABS3CT34_9ALTE|nr:XrtA/PEP-CTERM system TPR-repeat protein PrsT [Bowmanella yangjiangensis]MBN7820282.1 PEP-CTERM system TPR-repeat protein PrsT [Bowmanella yangjiangensis]
MKRLLYAALLLCCLPASANEASAYYEAAVKYQLQGKTDAAIIELKNCLGLQPDYLPARVLMGQVLLESGNAAAADKELTLALEMQADARAVVLNLVRAKLLQNYFTDAEDLLQRYASLQNMPDYVYLRGVVEKSQGNREAAQASFQQTLNLAPAHLEALTALAEMALQRDEMVGVSELLAKVFSVDPDYFPALILQAHVYRIEERFELAEQTYDRALRLKPGSEQAMLGKAGLLVEHEQLGQALQLVLAFREKNPGNPYAKLMHSALVAQQGQEREARQLLTDIQHQLSGVDDSVRKMREVSFLSAVVDYASGKLDSARLKFDNFIHEYGPTASAHRYLAMIALQQRNWREAKRQVERSLAISRQDPEVFVLAATIEQGLGQLSAALSLLEEAQQRFPAHAGVRQALIQAWVTSGQYTKAMTQLEKMQGDDLASRTLLGFLQLQHGQLADASKTTQALLDEHPGKVEILQLAGELSLKLGQPDNAERFFTEIIRLAPEFKVAHLALAGMYLNQKQLEKVEAQYQQVLAKDPKDLATNKLYADLAMTIGDTGKAIYLLEQVRESDDIEANRALLELYLQTERWTDAQGVLEQILKRRNLDEALLFTRAKLEEAQGFKDKAVSTLKALYGLAYDDLVKLHSVAHKQLDLGDLPGAEKSLARLHSLDAARIDIYLLARVALAQGNSQSALSILDNGLKSMPDNPRWQELRVHALIADGQMEVALNQAERLYLAEPKRANMQMLASLYSQYEQVDKALELLQTWLKSNPMDSWAVAQLSSLAAQQNASELAVATLKAYPKLAENPIFLNNLAYYLMESDLVAAQQYAEQANQLAPQVAQFNDTLGWIYARQGQTGKGLTLLREAQMRDSSNPMIMYHLAYTLHSLGENEQASRMLQRAVIHGLQQDLADELRGKIK